MLLVRGFQGGQVWLLARDGLVQELFHFREGRALVAFERQHLVRVGIHDLAGDGFLAMGRVGGDDVARQFQCPQKFGYAVISLLLSLTMRWPSNMPLWVAQALTITCADAPQT